MAETKNVRILLFINTGTEQLPVYSPVGGQRNATLAEEVGEIDLTTEDSNGASEFGHGLYSATIECDGLYIPTSAGYQGLKGAFRDREMIKVQIKEDDAATEEATCLITNMETSAPYDGETTYTASLRVSGAIRPVV
ncbi:phage tail tube protein [Peribacillus simplex]|uniref:Phage tail tube protein n=2 Tax=Peribacillus TaxID=2675229 RepID=A0AA90P4J8_9BACI|nr:MULTISPECIES: phage tail tube protein [Peribacillus]MDP1419231.1 phage tail tube protein [Peribacillus simplex]MDP1452131.1 phage tail tube protein [Peribacillus frigoritolerans]